MPRVLTVDGSVKIGAYRFPDRKKPCLCVEKGNVCTVYDPYWKPCIILNVDN